MVGVVRLKWLLAAIFVITTAECSADTEQTGLDISPLELTNSKNTPKRQAAMSTALASHNTAAKLSETFLQALPREREEMDPLLRAARELDMRERSGGNSEGNGDSPGDRILIPANDPLDQMLLTPLTLSALIDSFIVNTLRGGSAACRRGWGELFSTTDSNGVNNGIKALDAFGKLGAGYLQGNIYALGSYDECFSIASTQYCLAELSIERESVDSELSLIYAYCLPQTCSERDVHASLNLTSFELESATNASIKVDSVRCERDNKAPYNAGAIIMLLVWSMFAAMVIGATVFHIILKQREKIVGDRAAVGTAEASRSSARRRKTLMSFLLSFSLYKTVPTILATGKQPSSAITCIHGIRVMSICWIILAHSQLWASFYNENVLSYIRNMGARFSYRAILRGELSVDTFFMMSGLLVTYLTLRKMNRERGKFKFPALPYYLHRVLRITPVYAFVVFSFWLLTVHLADGPMWQRMLGPGGVFYESCERYWWTNLLYINNLYPTTHMDICMPWTWYLANDMQFFVLAPLVIIPLYHLWKAGLAILGAALVINLACLGGISGGYGLSVNVAKLEELNEAYSNEGSAAHNITDDLYTKPWTRVGPYLVGILMGFIFYRKLKPHFRREYCDYVFYATLWVVAAGLCFSTVYGLGDTINGELSRAEDISYQMFSRLAWSVGVAIITFVCHNGYGGIVNDFLSMKFWIPLSRLTFLTYLLHGVVLFVLVLTSRSPIYGHDIVSVLYWVTAVALSFGAAAIISSFVEFPLSNLEVALFKLAGVREGESARRSTVRRASEGVIEMNVGFQETDSVQRREGTQREERGEREGREMVRRSILRVREEETCEVQFNVGFEEEIERLEERGGEGEGEGVVELSMEGVEEGVGVGGEEEVEGEGMPESETGVNESETDGVEEDAGEIVVEMEEEVVEMVLGSVTERGSVGGGSERSEDGGSNTDVIAYEGNE